MPTRSYGTIKGIDKYLDVLSSAGKNVDDAIGTALGETAPMVTEDIHKRLKETSTKWTGATDATIYQTEPQRDGNYTFVEIGLDTAKDPSGFFDEFGTAQQAAEPFFRPAFRNMRHKWRNKMKEVLQRLGAL